MTATIYSLVDPRSDSIVYIGKTVRNIRDRYRSHCSKTGCKNGRLKRLVDELREMGLKLECRILEKCNPEDVDAREIFHIAKAREDGLDLCNVLNGGDGPAPGAFSEPIRAAMSRSASRYFSTPGARERHGEILKQAKSTPEARANASLAASLSMNRPEALEANRQQALERMSDPARKRAVSEDRKQYFSSEENRAKQSAALSSFYENNEDARRAASEKSKAQFASQEAREAASRRQKEWLAKNANFTSSQTRSVLMFPVGGGDPVRFNSIGAAGRAIGVKTNKVHYAINKGIVIDRYKFQYATA